MRPHALSFLIAAAIALTTVDAATCSSSQVQSSYGLFRSAAARTGCAPYAKSSADGGITIDWACSTTTCTPTMLQLALQLPNCETPTDGVNRKTQLESKLYTECQFCSPDQRDQIAALWKAAARTSACAPYAVGGGTFFSWPCSATSCTATLKDLANKVPSCVLQTQNERTRILNGISACTRTTVSTRTPSPASTSTSVSTTRPSATPPSVFTTTPPTATNSSSSNNSSSGFEDATSTPSPASNDSSSTSNDSSPVSNAPYSTCTPTQVDKLLSLFVETATSTNCKSYGTVSPLRVRITAPCSSSCVAQDVNALADALPDCYYAYEGENKQAFVREELDKCKPKSGRRMLQDAASAQSLTLQVDSKDVIPGASNASLSNSSTTAPPPAVSSDTPSCTRASATWVVGALLALAVVV